MKYDAIIVGASFAGLAVASRLRGRPELFEEMPDRFMVGTDEKFGRIHKEKRATDGVQIIKYGEDIKHMRSILGSINSNAAELIA